MPFASKAQRSFMHANHPVMAKRFEKDTSKTKKLPEHVEGSKSPVAKTESPAAKAVATAKVKAKNAQESIDYRKVERDVLEFVLATKPCRVDRDKGIIFGCKVVGFQSKNGGTYTREAIESACSMYDGAKCNLNHPRRDNPGLDRAVEDRFGIFHNPVLGDDGCYADLHYLKSHPFAARVCEAVESMPEVFGFSHNAKTIQVPDGQGGVIHESITRVRSVDLVADPATTCSIFESEEQVMNDPHTQDSTDAAGPAAGVEMNEVALENDPIDAAIDALLCKYLPQIKGADQASRKPLLKDLQKKIDAILNALSDEDEPEVTSEPSGGEEEVVEESVKVDEPVIKPAAKVVTPAKPDYEQALDVLESSNVQPTAIRIKALLALDGDDRQALADSWPKIGAAAVVAKPKPKSSSVLESLRDKEEKATVVPYPTDDQLKDDAMLLLAGSRLA